VSALSAQRKRVLYRKGFVYACMGKIRIVVQICGTYLHQNGTMHAETTGKEFSCMNHQSNDNTASSFEAVSFALQVSFVHLDFMLNGVVVMILLRFVNTLEAMVSST
jgi:hypothetical protein